MPGDMILTRGKCKECKDDAEKWLYSKKSELCRYHYSKTKERVKKPMQLKMKPIKKISRKQSARLKKYSVIRAEFLKENQSCQCIGCINWATEVHHKIGKIGERLFTKKYFMAVCRHCHKKIEESPLWAKANGYSLDRLNK